jgi:integrase
LTPQTPDTNINSLASLLDEVEFDSGELKNLLLAYATIKKKDAEKSIREEEKEKKEQQTTFYIDKEYIYPDRTDVSIYRDGRTKSGRYFVRIYDEKTRKVFTKSLRTSNRIAALAAAQNIYAENKERMRKGVKFVSLTTKELINMYLKEREGEISDTPHTGITQSSYDTLVSHLKYWELFIKHKKMSKRRIEDIPTETALDFAIWIQKMPKQFYKGKTRSHSTINHTIAAVKKCYRDIGIARKFITLAEFPQFKYLKVPKDNTPKRDVFNFDEYNDIGNWIRRKYINEKEITDKERVIRKLYGFFFTIHHNTGMRVKEILGLRWGDVNPIPTDKGIDRVVRRGIYIPTDNSKTGKSRTIVSPVGKTFDSIKKVYQSLGVECKTNDLIFTSTAKTRIGLNYAWGQPLVDKRLKNVCKLAEEAGVWKSENRNITNYSARHYFATQSLMRKLDIYEVALNMGTSVYYLEQTYSHITTIMKSDELTKGQGYYKHREEQEEKKEVARNAIEDALGKEEYRRKYKSY